MSGSGRGKPCGRERKRKRAPGGEGFAFEGRVWDDVRVGTAGRAVVELGEGGRFGVSS